MAQVSWALLWSFRYNPGGRPASPINNDGVKIVKSWQHQHIAYCIMQSPLVFSTLNRGKRCWVGSLVSQVGKCYGLI